MKKLTGIVAISFMAGMFCFGVGERVADEVWAPKVAEAHWKNLSLEDQSLFFQTAEDNWEDCHGDFDCYCRLGWRCQ